MGKKSNRQSHPKILIIKSGCAYNKECEYNKGSLAVIITASKTIRHFLPESQIMTFIQLSDKLSRKIGVNVIKKKKLNTLRDYSIKNSLLMNILVFRCTLWSYFHKVGLNLQFLKSNNLLKVFDEADVIVDLSLDAYSDDYGTRHILEISGL